MSAALFLVVVFRLRKKEPATFLRNPKVWAVTAIYALSLTGWFAFFYAIWGRRYRWPHADRWFRPHRSIFGLERRVCSSIRNGLLAYAPVYVLAGTGLYQMWRAGGELRRQAIEIIFIFAALLATVGAFGIWWAARRRPLAPLPRAC
jgi:hypothetical protein